MIHAILILGARRERVARGLDESVEDLVLCAGRGIEPSGCFGLALESGPPGPPNARFDAPERRRGHLSGTSELPGLDPQLITIESNSANLAAESTHWFHFP